MSTQDKIHTQLLIQIKQGIETVQQQNVEIVQMIQQLDERLLVVEEKLAVLDTRMWGSMRPRRTH